MIKSQTSKEVQKHKVHNGVQRLYVTVPQSHIATKAEENVSILDRKLSGAYQMFGGDLAIG